MSIKNNIPACLQVLSECDQPEGSDQGCEEEGGGGRGRADDGGGVLRGGAQEDGHQRALRPRLGAGLRRPLQESG